MYNVERLAPFPSLGSATQETLRVTVTVKVTIAQHCGTKV